MLCVLLSLLGLHKRKSSSAAPGVGNSFEFELDVAPKPVSRGCPHHDSKRVREPQRAPIGDDQIRNFLKKNAKAWNQGDAPNLPHRVGIRKL